MPNPIPDKGKVLTQLSKFWFDLTKDILPNHVISTEVEDFPKECQPYKENLRGRAMLVVKTNPLPVECVVRGYLSGSGWEEYKERGEVCGIWSQKRGSWSPQNWKNPFSLRLPKQRVVFHDENITLEKVEKVVGKDLARQLKSPFLGHLQKGPGFCRTAGMV